MSDDAFTVSPVPLEAFVTQLFRQHGLSDNDAGFVANTLVQSDLWGHQSHGVLRTSWYIERLRHGVMTPVTCPEIVRDRNCFAVVDGKEGVGQIIAKQAMEMAIAKAKAHGVGTVAIRNSNHLGTVMYFTQFVSHACVEQNTF